MYLQKLEIQGFKSFANRTILEFPSANGKGKGITAVVGPNGSGKSNIADAIRWVLGEQSMKTLRGKKSEDVIFFGSDKKSRVGMAEVSLYLNNEDGQAQIDYSELVITRRLYRDGESEYLLNKSRVRLGDILILLAKANFGQRTYSVIGQGMVDHFLVATQSERKEFFDEAAGVKEYQIKRDQTLNKLLRTEENLKTTDVTLQELGPRYRSLGRLVKRLEQRGEIETELRGIQQQYYGQLYFDINEHWQKYQSEFKAIEDGRLAKHENLGSIQQKLNQLEQEDSGQEAFEKLQQQFNQILDKKNQLQSRQLILQSKIQLAKEQAQQDFIPLGAEEMAQYIEELISLHEALISHVDQIKELVHLGQVKDQIHHVKGRLKDLLGKVRKPADEEIKIDQELEAELKITQEALGLVAKELVTSQRAIADFNLTQQEKKGEFFDLQRQFAGQQSELNNLSIKVNDIKIELAKLETRKEDLEREIKREMGDVELPTSSQQPAIGESGMAEAYDKIQKLKRQLELIGGLDDESIREYEEIKVRYEFLNEQYQDLTQAIESLRQIIRELDEEIHKRFDETFQNINAKFGEYFQVLFGGGKASLEKIMIEIEDDEEELDESGKVVNKPAYGGSAGGGKARIGDGSKELEYGGVEIKACPPGKRISSLNTLSGGERAMTAIALICAIIACNPSPFVVLDEVDAALDEANSERLSNIVETLAHKTQFIIVTHNRTTMAKGDVLYGVTMGDDSVSKMLSIKLEEGQQYAK
ncbi:MAG: AAA family ATPase [Patescibacteria group bacterium]